MHLHNGLASTTVYEPVVATKTSSRLWIIGAVVGSVVVLGLILWCVLYIHYSNKKRLQQTKPKTLSDDDSVEQEELKVVKKGRRAKVRRGLSIPVFVVKVEALTSMLLNLKLND